jgi:hypothetical protein
VSDDLLAKVEDLRDPERRKRDEPISSPALHGLAQEVTNKSRDSMYAATLEQALGNDTERGEETIDVDDEDVDDEASAG